MTHAEAWERLPELVELRAANLDDLTLRDHIAGCQQCQARLARLERLAGALHDAAGAPLPVPDGLGLRVRAVPGQVDRLRRRLWRRGLSVGAPALAAAIGAVILALGVIGPSSDPPFRLDRTVALHPMGSARTEGRVDVSLPSGQYRIVRVNVHGLPAAHRETYDLWMMDGRGAMKAGTFGPDPDGHCEVELMVPASEGWSTMAITKSGDSPHDAPLAQSAT